MEIAVTGIGILSALGNNQYEFWDNIQSGKTGIREMVQLDSSELLTNYAGEVRNLSPEKMMTQEEIEETERCTQLSFLAASEALKQADIPAGFYNTFKQGVILGTSLGGIPNGEKFHKQWIREGYEHTDPNLLLSYPLHTAADFLSVRFNLKGPKVAISTACSAGSNAIGYGIELIKSGKADMLIVGGADPLSMLSLAGFNSLKALSDEPCSPYSQSKGITLAEGAGVLILERLDRVKDRGGKILSLVTGFGLTSDAYHPTAPNPGGAGAFKSMQMALERSNITSQDIDYVNGHGTGTRANDSAETTALKNLFSNTDKNVPVSSTKSMIGHTLGAAGAVEGITCVLSLMKQTAPPTISFTNNPYNMDFIPNVSRPMAINTVLSNSFAFGGNNASLIFKKYEEEKQQTEVLSEIKQKVLITGIGCVQPLGIGKDELWESIEKGNSAINPIDFEKEKYIGKLGASVSEKKYLKYINPSLIRRLDLLGKLSLASSKMALNDSGIKINRDNSDKIAVIYGTSSGPLQTVEDIHRTIVVDGVKKVNPSQFPNTVMNAAAGHICSTFQIKGPSTTICTGNVAGSQSITYAYHMINEGLIDAALVVVADEYTETIHAGYDRLGVLGNAPYPFERDSDGMALSCGSTALFLESEKHAKERKASVYGQIKGYGITSDAYKLAGNNPNGKAYSYAMSDALKESELSVDEIDAIFSDARGLRSMDLTEVNAIRHLGGAKIPVTTLSNKNGYNLSGMTPLHIVAALQTFNNHKIPGLKVKNPIYKLNFAKENQQLHSANNFLFNSANFGGTYTSVVVGRYES
ncbi:3-oxoacyl-[acyl-carrier-protein] synthase, KASII (plasmid) [Priestia megaterium]|uniref:beta-ketoacyl-[acyl-carrier-protein] synthase family protein n=1 Tax=Priestia megaterium TaxID=1404 RepID=UPI0006AB8E8E|nr:beta-ketoacyl-[acyl-carrier-protein] synthase family protein [Priestia megaterium]KOP63640.1 hypothetical protein AMS61_29770 [Bacillus sp. FJAT-21351]QLK09526.1 3-oxoacyl-[acyl-carrier-protein] synthase, KASII [Priestia megaterium]